MGGLLERIGQSVGERIFINRRARCENKTKTKQIHEARRVVVLKQLPGRVVETALKTE